MFTTLGIIAVFVIIYFLNKDIQKRFEAETATVFFKLDFDFQKLLSHSFVKHELIPYLKKKKFSEKLIEEEKTKIKKEFKEWDKDYPSSKRDEEFYSDENLEKIFWQRKLHELINNAITEEGKDKSLSFRIFNLGSRDNRYTWDNLYKNFYDDFPEFSLTLFSEDDSLFGGNVYLRSKRVYQKKNGTYFSFIKIYLFISKGMFEKKEEEKGEEVGILLELPVNLIGTERYILLSKEAEKARLYEAFELKDFNKEHEGDFYMDELGEGQSVGKKGFTVGNDFVKAWII